MFNSKDKQSFALATTSLLFFSISASAQQPVPDMCGIENGHLKPDMRRTLVITQKENPEIFANDAFSLSRTLEQILRTAVDVTGLDAQQAETKRNFASGRAEQVALLASLIRSFRESDRVNPSTDTKVPMPVVLRPGEAALDPLKLLGIDNSDPKEVLRPTALFNRLDLAPANWSYCGEHRIVYAKADTAGEPVSNTNRFLLIFEAALDNPDPQNTERGCLAVAQFWNMMRAPGQGSLADDLRKFYYQGIDGIGTPNFKPVIHFDHYALPFGQVRGNLFAAGGQARENAWMLREWRVGLGLDKAPIFISETVKSNPHPALYSAEPAGENQLFADLRPEFQKDFVLSHVREMIDVDLASQQSQASIDSNMLLSRMGARFENRFNSFDSVSQGAPQAEDDPKVRATGTDLPASIETELKNYKLPSILTADQILARAGALSCGGCHDFSVGQKISATLEWPKVAGRFVHVKEDGVISEALESHFLPDRCVQLQDFLKRNEPVMASLMRAGPQRSATRVPAQAVETRIAVERLQQAPNRLQAIDAQRMLETEVLSSRRQDRQQPGAFVTFRRPH